MKGIFVPCECLEKLVELGRVAQYVPPYNTIADGYEAEEGQVCIVHNFYEDYGTYADYEWISNIVEYKELYPINYCPICGKEIQYKSVNRLTKNR